MTQRATFGDFLHAAHQSLAHRPGEPPPTRGDVDEVSRSLLRVITILSRYAQDTATAFSDVPHHTPALLSPWGRGRAQAREVLTHAAGFLLRPGTGRPVWPGPRSASPLARRLDEMAACLAAGRDLLHTHFAPGPHGGRAHRSEWALTITSERVNRALLAELAALAQPIAHYGANVALAPVPGTPPGADQRRALNAACQWLWVLATSIEAASRQEPVSAADRQLLAAIPFHALPARPALAAADTVPGLCDGVITTAERLRHLAWQSARQPPWTPALTATSLRQAAETSTLTSHHCALLAATLAERTTSGARADLDAATRAARTARGTWYQIARALREVTTDTRGHITPAAAEARDLAWWTGRLAYADPAWTFSSGPRCAPRPPQHLAPQPDDLPQVVAAVHQATDALALLADTEYGQLRGAVQAGRIMVPTRTLTDDYDIPHPYAPAPEERIRALLARYQDATQASRQATAPIGRAAHATGAPSRVLTTAQEATGTTWSPSPALDASDPAAHRNPDQTPDMRGPLEHTLQSLGVTNTILLARGADLDHASQCLLIDAADELPLEPKRASAAGVNQTAASAALLNHALATGNPQAARLLRQPDQPQRKEPELEPEP